MARLVFLVVAAAWAAVLIPPMIRSRADNRPNSSVTDFRRQLNRLQSTATPTRGSVRAMGRPLAQSSSPLQRQAATGRPGQATLRNNGAAVSERPAEPPRYRTHGDSTAGQRRSQPGVQRSDRTDGQRRPSHRTTPNSAQRAAERTPGDRVGQTRRPEPARGLADTAAVVRRRRSNVLFVLVVTSACTMFLSATTDSSVMLWAFGLSFIATCAYVYVLAQLREREQVGWNDGWLE